MNTNGLPIKIELPAGFLDEEVRSGFTVVEKQKRIWAVELDLLHEFMRVCSKYNVQYQIFAGTLLGAVRHGGFIPWDDDLDVCLDRKNFNKLCKVASTEFRRPYFFQTAASDRKFFLGFARLRNSETTGITRWTNSPDYNNGIFIDVYVMDGLAPWPAFVNKQRRILKKIRRGMSILTKDKVTSSTIWGNAFRLIRPVLSFGLLVRTYNFTMSAGKYFSGKVAQMTHEPEIFNNHWLTKRELKESENIQFEWLQVPAPIDRDRILHRIYGDYLRFPPVEERGKWHNDMIYFDPDIPYAETFARGLPLPWN